MVGAWIVFSWPIGFTQLKSETVLAPGEICQPVEKYIYNAEHISLGHLGSLQNLLFFSHGKSHV